LFHYSAGKLTAVIPPEGAVGVESVSNIPGTTWELDGGYQLPGDARTNAVVLQYF
jgi:hypothetical protein